MDGFISFEKLIPLIIGVVVFIISRAYKNAAKKIKEEASLKSYNEEYHQESSEVYVDNIEREEIPFKQENLYSSTPDHSSASIEIVKSEIITSSRAKSGILKDFDPVKAIIYSEIMKPKYID